MALGSWVVQSYETAEVILLLSITTSVQNSLKSLRIIQVSCIYINVYRTMVERRSLLYRFSKTFSLFSHDDIKESQHWYTYKNRD